MNGPINRDKKGRSFDWMEIGMVFAGMLVVVGLFLESWPEIKLAINERRFPNLTVTGGFIVTVGVLAEVVLGIFITQRANRAQSEANERVAKAEQAAAEANQLAGQERLERIKLERELSPRWFENQHEAIERLRPFSGTEVVLMYPPDLECARTAEQIAFVFDGAGWKFDPQPLLQLNPLCEEGITIEAYLGIVGRPSAGTALIEELNKAGFGPKRPPGIPPKEPGPIRMWVGMKPRALDGKINQHIAAMEKQMNDSVAQGKAPDLSKFREAMEEEFSNLKPGTHGGRFVLPRWPVTPL
jgi:hypothetical protein